MRNTITHPVYGRIDYEETLWTGKRSLSFNGIALQKKAKNEYGFAGDSAGTQVTVLGSAFMGVSLWIGDEEIQIIPKPTWYDWILSFLPFALMIVWGNNVYLCSIVPVVGGAIGGALGGAAAVITMSLLRGKSTGRKLLTVLLATLATFAVGATLGFAIVVAMIS